MLTDFRRASGKCFDSVCPRVSGVVGQCLVCEGVLAFGWVQNTMPLMLTCPRKGAVECCNHQWDRATSVELSLRQ